MRIVNEETNEELIRYDLAEDFSIETAIIAGELYRHNGEWKFSAIGSGYQGGLVLRQITANRLNHIKHRRERQHMAIQLAKGQRVDLTKRTPVLQKR